MGAALGCKRVEALPEVSEPTVPPNISAFWRNLNAQESDDCSSARQSVASNVSVDKVQRRRAEKYGINYSLISNGRGDHPFKAYFASVAQLRYFAEAAPEVLLLPWECMRKMGVLQLSEPCRTNYTFISHQWESAEHPFPDMKQLTEHLRGISTPFIWIDWYCTPQWSRHYSQPVAAIFTAMLARFHEICFSAADGLIVLKRLPSGLYIASEDLVKKMRKEALSTELSLEKLGQPPAGLLQIVNEIDGIGLDLEYATRAWCALERTYLPNTFHKDVRLLRLLPLLKILKATCKNIEPIFVSLVEPSGRPSTAGKTPPSIDKDAVPHLLGTISRILRVIEFCKASAENRRLCQNAFSYYFLKRHVFSISNGDDYQYLDKLFVTNAVLSNDNGILFARAIRVDKPRSKSLREMREALRVRLSRASLEGLPDLREGASRALMIARASAATLRTSRRFSLALASPGVGSGGYSSPDARGSPGGGSEATDSPIINALDRGGGSVAGGSSMLGVISSLRVSVADSPNSSRVSYWSASKRQQSVGTGSVSSSLLASTSASCKNLDFALEESSGLNNFSSSETSSNIANSSIRMHPRAFNRADGITGSSKSNLNPVVERSSVTRGGSEESTGSTTFPEEEEEEGWVGAQEIAKLCASFSTLSRSDTQSLSESNSTFTKRPRLTLAELVSCNVARSSTYRNSTTRPTQGLTEDLEIVDDDGVSPELSRSTGFGHKPPATQLLPGLPLEAIEAVDNTDLASLDSSRSHMNTSSFKKRLASLKRGHSSHSAHSSKGSKGSKVGSGFGSPIKAHAESSNARSLPSSQPSGSSPPMRTRAKTAPAAASPSAPPRLLPWQRAAHAVKAARRTEGLRVSFNPASTPRAEHFTVGTSWLRFADALVLTIEQADMKKRRLILRLSDMGVCGGVPRIERLQVEWRGDIADVEAVRVLLIDTRLMRLQDLIDHDAAIRQLHGLSGLNLDLTRLGHIPRSFGERFGAVRQAWDARPVRHSTPTATPRRDGGRKKPMRPPAISRLSSVVRARQRSRPRATKPFPLRLRTASTNRRRRSRVALALSRGDRLLSAEADSAAMPLALVGDAITSAVRKRAALSTAEGAGHSRALHRHAKCSTSAQSLSSADGGCTSNCSASDSRRSPDKTDTRIGGSMLAGSPKDAPQLDAVRMSLSQHVRRRVAHSQLMQAIRGIPRVPSNITADAVPRVAENSSPARRRGSPRARSRASCKSSVSSLSADSGRDSFVTRHDGNDFAPGPLRSPLRGGRGLESLHI